MSEKLFKLRITDNNGQTETEPLPKGEADLNFENRVLVEVKLALKIEDDHNWQLELINAEDGTVVREFVMETNNASE
jgi:hypothetical protein